MAFDKAYKARPRTCGMCQIDDWCINITNPLYGRQQDVCELCFGKLNKIYNSLRNGQQHQLNLAVIEMLFNELKIQQAWLEIRRKQVSLADEIQKAMEQRFNKLRVLIAINFEEDVEPEYWCLKNDKGEILVGSLGNGAWVDKK